MNHTKNFQILVLLFAVVLCFGHIGLAGAVGTAWTYQGRLIDANEAADGEYDFQFKLFDANSGGNQLGTDVNKPEVDVIDGYFTIDLDFGQVFDGNERWLDIGVRPGDLDDPNAYTALSPRQAITPTPYALYAKNAQSVAGGVDWSGILNIPAGFADGIDDVGLTAETDPTVLASVKDGVSWAEVSAIPAGFADGVDDVGAGDNLGNHTATQNVKLNGYWLSSDGDSEGVYVANTGNVGIGTTGPGSILQVAAISDTAGQGIRIGDASTPWGAMRTAITGTGAIVFDTWSGSAWNSGVMVLTVGGNVGIGTTSPAAKLDVAGHINSDESYKLDGTTVLANTGNQNIFVGQNTGVDNTTGYYDTFTGNYAGRYNTTGAYNTFTGNYAGYANIGGSYNTLSGYCAGYLNQTGSGNVFLGYNAGYNETGSNKLYIANSDVNPPLIYGDFSTGNVGIGTASPTEKLEVTEGTIKATNSATTGMGIYGEASNNGDYYNYGVFGVSNGGKGRGVYGVAGNTGNYINIGGWFLANGARGIGVYGQASKSGDYENYGGYFESWGTSGRGVYGRAAGSSGVGVYGKGSVGVESEGDLVVSGASSAYRGNIGPNNGAPFPRPAYDSGWVPIAQGELLTLTHNIGGNVDNYVVDMMFADDGNIHNRFYGGMLGWDGENWDYYGAYWTALTANTIKAFRSPDEDAINRVRIRIWVYN